MAHSTSKRQILFAVIVLSFILTTVIVATPAAAAVCAAGTVCGLDAGFTCPQTVSFIFDFTPLPSPPGVSGFAAVNFWDVKAVNNNTSAGDKTGGQGAPSSPQTGTLIVPAVTGDTITVTLWQNNQQVDEKTLTVNCNAPSTFDGCGKVLPRYTTAIMTTGQTTRAHAKSGDPASDQFDNPIFLPIDADGGGIDEYLVVDYVIGDFNGDGLEEFWVGLFIGTACQPVFVPVENVTLTSDFPAYDDFLAGQGGSQ